MAGPPNSTERRRADRLTGSDPDKIRGSAPLRRSPQTVETAAGGRVIALCEAAYPETLAAIADPPPLVFLRGYAAVLTRPRSPSSAPATRRRTGAGSRKTLRPNSVRQDISSSPGWRGESMPLPIGAHWQPAPLRRSQAGSMSSIRRSTRNYRTGSPKRVFWFPGNRSVPGRRRGTSRHGTG
jgi:hypothetical protein